MKQSTNQLTTQPSNHPTPSDDPPRALGGGGRTATAPPICNYEGSTYRTDFWEGQGREYEDRVERVALSALLPRAGRRLIELGAGYGRLADLYDGYQQVVLTDRAFTQVQQAKERLNSTSPPTPLLPGEEGTLPLPEGEQPKNEYFPRFYFVVADAYALPFRAQAAEQVVSVRMLHHLVDVPRALAEIARVVADGGCYITEFASKRHLKAMLRYTLRRQLENPFAPRPHEFVKLNFDFHPRWMEQELARVGFRVEAKRAVSHFRVGWLKRHVPVRLLVAADRAWQRLGGLWPWTPSVFVRARKGR